MIRNYFKIAWRQLTKNKGYSFINVGGLAVGMAVALLISLWIYDELSFNKNHKNYKQIAQVYQFVTFGGNRAPYAVMPIPMSAELRNNYPDFKKVSLASQNQDITLSYGDKNLIKTGVYAETDFTDIMSFKMVKGSSISAQDVNSIIISETLASTLFGNEDPLNKMIRFDNKSPVKVIGVYEDLPTTSNFKDLLFVAPWKLYAANDNNIRSSETNWDNNNFNLYVQLNEGADFDQASSKIKNVRMAKDTAISYKPTFFLHPMKDWHLRTSWENGVKAGGPIEFVWLFGCIGLFILALACINFMNLSTARSEKRAKEIGVRKVVGSIRGQLIGQFFMESLLVVSVAFIIALGLLQLAIPMFNEVSGKNIVFIGANGIALQPLFWLASLLFIALTGLMAGIYPAIYLSSFRPVKVLKGTFKVGNLAVAPRKVLVVFQFTISIFLVIGTAVVFKQIQHAKDRPMGYNRDRLVAAYIDPAILQKNRDGIRNDLLNSGAVAECAESGYSVTSYGGLTDALQWEGKDPRNNPLVGTMAVSHEFGKTIRWKVKEGRDFSREFSTDSNALVINQATAKLIGFKSSVGQRLRLYGKDYSVIGVVDDLVMESPFESIKPTIFILNYNFTGVVDIRLNPANSVSASMASIEKIFQKYNPGAAFNYSFVDEAYSNKFKDEVRIGKLATFFTILAIFISCLGLFGLAAFIAAQRTKEIGVRKVIGASVLNLWILLSKDFMILVFIAIIIASPLSYYFMNNWIGKYSYQASMSWWIFAGTAAAALIVTLATVSFQAIKAAITNPVKSLRTE